MTVLQVQTAVEHLADRVSDDTDAGHADLSLLLGIIEQFHGAGYASHAHGNLLDLTLRCRRCEVTP